MGELSFSGSAKTMERTSDYKFLYEQQRMENEEYKRRIFELEARQRVLECSFRGLKQLRHELSSLHKESEESEKNIQSFLSSFLPEYKDYSRYKRSTPSGIFEKKDQNNNEVPERKLDSKKDAENRLKLSNSKPSDNKAAAVLPDDSAVDDNVGEKLPIPTVSYDWCDPNTSSNRLPSYLPKSGYSLSSLTGKYGNVTGRSLLLDDELKLTLKFENCPSRNLPTKLQLEICDAQGNVVFRKRQNIYYVKLQEKLAALDSGNDYILTVTSIQGVNKTSEKVTIHNKHYQPPPEPCKDKTVISEMPELMTALQEFSNEVEFFEEAEVRKPQEIIDVPVSAVTVTEENFAQQAKKSSALVLQRAPLEDTDENCDLSSSTSGIGTSTNSIDRPLPLIMSRKPILPMEIRSRWQSGFRRKAPGAGQYIKVPILRVEIDFDPDQFELLPQNLSVTLVLTCQQSHLIHKMEPTNQISKLSHNRRFCAEFPFFNTFYTETCCHIQVTISEKGATSSGLRKSASLVPDFAIFIARAQEEESNLGWRICTPEIIQFF